MGRLETGLTMRFLAISAVFPPHVIGGAERSAYGLARQLARRGHDVAALTLAEPDEPEVRGRTNGDGIREYRIRLPRARTTFNAHFKPMGRIGTKIWHLQDLYDPRNITAVRSVLDEVRPDHLNVHLPDGIGFNYLPLVNRTGASATFFLHDFSLVCSRGNMFRDGRECESECGKCGTIRRMKFHFVRKVQRASFVAPSQSALDRVKSREAFVRERPHAVIRNIPDDPAPDVPVRSARDDRLRLIYVGRLHETKGIDLLMKALDRLSGRHRFTLSILGTGPLEASLKDAFGGKDWACFEGFVDQSVVAERVAAADLMAVPSIWSEVYGRVTVQALQSGVPVIGSNKGGTAELVRHGVTGLLVEPGDLDAWTAALDTLMGDPDRLAELRAGAAAHADEFDPNRIAARYEDFVAGLREAA